MNSHQGVVISICFALSLIGQVSVADQPASFYELRGEEKTEHGFVVEQYVIDVTAELPDPDPEIWQTWLSDQYDRDKRELLCETRYPPDVLISPDASLLLVSVKVVSNWATLYLYRRTEDLKFVKDESVDWG